jgi:hypothetical protein
MTENQIQPGAPAASTVTVLDSGTYEIIRQRLDNQARQLKECLDKLNTSRKAVFGTVDTSLTGSERITTRNSCIPRDMATFGRKFLFGYNVQFGLKSMTAIEDVFAIYDFQNGTFKETSLDLINDERFQRDFQELYKYYKSTSLSKLHNFSPCLYMVFSTGKDKADIKAFKWRYPRKARVYRQQKRKRDYRSTTA